MSFQYWPSFTDARKFHDEYPVCAECPLAEMEGIRAAEVAPMFAAIAAVTNCDNTKCGRCDVRDTEAFEAWRRPEAQDTTVMLRYLLAAGRDAELFTVADTGDLAHVPDGEGPLWDALAEALRNYLDGHAEVDECEGMVSEGSWILADGSHTGAVEPDTAPDGTGDLAHVPEVES